MLLTLEILGPGHEVKQSHLNDRLKGENYFNSRR